MKLVLATPLFPPDLGGPATYAKLLNEHLPEAGDMVQVVNFGEVRHLPKGIRHLAYFLRVLTAAQNADVIMALDPVSVGFPTAIASRILRKPFVVKVVGDFAWEQGTQRFGITQSLDEFVQQKQVPFAVSLLRTIQTYTVRKADQLIVPSEYLKGILAQWSSKISTEKISVIYNSAENSEEVPAVNSSEHTSPQSHQILSVGRLVPWKGMPSLILATAEVRKEIPDATLVLVGEGPEKESLQKKAREVFGESTDLIISFTGSLSHVDTMRALQSAEVFVLNSTYEGLSHTVIEALSLGSAIVVSDAGGNPELIQNEVNGLTIPAPGEKSPDENIESLAAAIIRLMKDSEFREKVQRTAKESSMRFQVSVMIQKTRALLETVSSTQ